MGQRIFLYFQIIITALCTCSTQRLFAQRKIWSGIVVNKVTGEPVAYASISYGDNFEKGTSTDKEGHFLIKDRSDIKLLRVTAVGFRTTTRQCTGTPDSTLTILLESQDMQLEEVVIKKIKKIRYRNKDNPAVDFVRMVIDAKDKNNARNADRYNYLSYDKLSMSLSMANAHAPRSWLLRKFPFLKNNLDTTMQPGRSLVPVFLQEKSAYVTYFNHQLAHTQTLAAQESRIDQKFDEDGLDEFMDKIYGLPDLYDHDIQLGNTRFLSPIASEAPLFYKYFIVDTIKSTIPWQIQLSVSPRNREDALITGMIFVSLDGTYAVQHAELKVGNNANVNWVNDIHFEIQYSPTEKGKYYLSKSTMALDLGLFKEGMSVFGIKTFVASGFDKEIPVGTSTAEDEQQRITASLHPERLDQLRPEKLTGLELSGFENVDSLENNRSFNRYMDIASFLFSGFIDLGKIEAGPFSTVYSFNPIEGNRFRIGGRTTDAFSRKVVLDAYVAYGDFDRRMKHRLGTTFSFTENSVYTFPVRSMSLFHAYDVEIPGQALNYISDDSFLLSFKRGENDKMWYKDTWTMEYLHELENHLSFKVALNSRVIEPTGALAARGTASSIDRLRLAEVSAEIRWAPHEKFFQGKRYRRIITEGYPIFSLRTELGLRGFLSGEHNYQKFTFNASKRFYASQFGFSDIQLEGGLLYGKLPYPLLAIHRANQSYTYQLSSYNLMNFMEFASDRYASLNVQHAFNGFFLNKVPLIKRLQLREMASFKILTGSLSNSNVPSQNSDLPRFPVDINGNSLMHGLSGSPYIEGSIGLANIFKLLRIDYVRRFSYLNNPQVSPWGIRARLYVEF